jgi:hypothetical protein
MRSRHQSESLEPVGVPRSPKLERTHDAAMTNDTRVGSTCNAMFMRAFNGDSERMKKKTHCGLVDCYILVIALWRNMSLLKSLA